jgi:rod shape-determining protein MreC
LEFLRGNRLLIAIAVALSLGAGLVLVSRDDRVRNDSFGRLLVDAMAPIQQGASLVATTVGRIWSGITGAFRTRDQLRVLRAELRERSRALVHLREIELENERLRRLIDFRPRIRDEVVAARVIGRDALGASRSFVIDRGTNDGVERGAAVVAPDGLVGHVFLAGRQASRVLLVTDHNSGVDAIVQRTRARGIVEGRIGGGCGLKFVKRTESLDPGDLVITSGVDGIFPKGLPIGRISTIDKRGPGLFQYAFVEPTVDFDVLEEVLVVQRAPRQIPPPAEPAPR